MRLPRPLAWLALALGLAACARVPYTGRRQYDLPPDALIEALGARVGEARLAGASPVAGEDAALVERVGRSLAEAAGRRSGGSVVLLDDPAVDAWCLPGGPCAVHAGLLPVVEHEAGLAFALAHALGHVLGRHPAERLVQQAAPLGGLTGLGAWVDGTAQLSPEQRAVLAAALGPGADLPLRLPYSRPHEEEADVFALMTMAAAGYPPEQSLGVWVRVEQHAASTPSDLHALHGALEGRKELLRARFEKAKKRWERNRERVPGDATTPRW